MARPKHRQPSHRTSGSAAGQALAVLQIDGGDARPIALGANLVRSDADEFAIDETEAILFALARAVEQRDHDTAGHCERLAFASVALGMAMGLANM